MTSTAPEQQGTPTRTVLLRVALGCLAFGLVVWGLTVLMMKSDHYDQRRAFERACQRDGYFLEFRGGIVTNCIDRDHRIVRQYVR